MPNASHAVQSCLTRLQAYFVAQISTLTVYPEWPSANQKLVYPAMSMFQGKVNTMNRQPEIIATSAPDTDGKVTVTEIVGEHDFKIQLDLWCRNKPERDTYLGLVMDAINLKVADTTGNNNPAGLSLQLTDYFNDWVRFDLDGWQLVDDEAGVQRQERRAKIDLLVNCRAIRERILYAIEQIEIHDAALAINGSLADTTVDTESHDVF